MKKKTITWLNVVLNAIAAIVWSANCLILIIYTRYNKPPEIILLLDLLCAMIWWVSFAVLLIRYLNSKKDQ